MASLAAASAGVFARHTLRGLIARNGALQQRGHHICFACDCCHVETRLPLVVLLHAGAQPVGPGGELLSLAAQAGV